MVMAPPRCGLFLHQTYPALDSVVAFLGIGCALGCTVVTPLTLLLGAVNGELDDERRSATGRLADPDAAAVRLDDRVHDREPDTPAAAAGAVGAVEALEDVGALVGRYAVSVVADVQRDVERVHAADEDLDRGAGRGVDPGVGHEVGDDLSQLLLVGLQLRRLDGPVDAGGDDVPVGRDGAG